MAKVAVINRNLKRRETVKKFAARRAELLAIINNAGLSDEEGTLRGSNFRCCPVIQARYGYVIVVR